MAGSFDANAFVISGVISTVATGNTAVFLAPCDVELKGTQFLLGTASTSGAVTVNVKVNPPTSPAVYQLGSYTTQNGVVVSNGPTIDTSKPATPKAGDITYPTYAGAADFTLTGVLASAYASDISIAATKKTAQGGAADNLDSPDGRVSKKIFAGSLVNIAITGAGTGAANLYYGLEFAKA